MDDGAFCMDKELHPLKPFLPEGARMLMLGSFPPQRKRWSMDFYYPNLQNDMWRIFGCIFFGDKEHFLLEGRKAFDKERLVAFLQEKGIALFDAATSVRRLQGNASDKYLEVVRPTDVLMLLRQIPLCRAVVTTGQKATDILRSQVAVAEPQVGLCAPFRFDGRELHLWRMPSSSRAYPKPIEEKADCYRRMFREMELL